jgi:hypothetical protein
MFHRVLDEFLEVTLKEEKEWKVTLMGLEQPKKGGSNPNEEKHT